LEFFLELIHDARNDEHKILIELHKKSAKSGTKVSAKRTSYSKSVTMERMEKMFSTWIEIQSQRHVPVSTLLVQAKAHSEDLPKSDDNVKPFSSSTSWFSRLTKSYKFHNIKTTGEAASADTAAVIHYIGRGYQSLTPGNTLF
jgi:hypothetical protein